MPLLTCFACLSHSSGGSHSLLPLPLSASLFLLHTRREAVRGGGAWQERCGLLFCSDLDFRPVLRVPHCSCLYIPSDTHSPSPLAVDPTYRKDCRMQFKSDAGATAGGMAGADAAAEQMQDCPLVGPRLCEGRAVQPAAAAAVTASASSLLLLLPVIVPCGTPLAIPALPSPLSVFKRWATLLPRSLRLLLVLLSLRLQHGPLTSPHTSRRHHT